MSRSLSRATSSRRHRIPEGRSANHTSCEGVTGQDRRQHLRGPTGRRWLACPDDSNPRVLAVVHLAASVEVTSEAMWRSKIPNHGMDRPARPYRRTLLSPVLLCQELVMPALHKRVSQAVGDHVFRSRTRMKKAVKLRRKLRPPPNAQATTAEEPADEGKKRPVSDSEIEGTNDEALRQAANASDIPSLYDAFVSTTPPARHLLGVKTASWLHLRSR